MSAGGISRAEVVTRVTAGWLSVGGCVVGAIIALGWRFGGIIYRQRLRLGSLVSGTRASEELDSFSLEEMGLFDLDSRGAASGFREKYHLLVDRRKGGGLTGVDRRD